MTPLAAKENRSLLPEPRSARQILRERLAIFRVRPYAFYFTGNIVSMTGTGMQLIANGWLALQLTHTSLSVAIVRRGRIRETSKSPELDHEIPARFDEVTARALEFIITSYG